MCAKNKHRIKGREASATVSINYRICVLFLRFVFTSCFWSNSLLRLSDPRRLQWKNKRRRFESLLKSKMFPLSMKEREEVILFLSWIEWRQHLIACLFLFSFQETRTASCLFVPPTLFLLLSQEMRSVLHSHGYLFCTWVSSLCVCFSPLWLSMILVQFQKMTLLIFYRVMLI